MKINKLMTFQLIAAIAASISLTSCNNSAVGTSSVTGWKLNDNRGGFQYNTAYDGTQTPYGMVAVEGGTFTMGRIQSDVMGEWNNNPTQQFVQSFYMDETEVTNLMYGEYLYWLKQVYPPSEAQYRNIYQSALPDTLVWRNKLGFSETLTNTYLRHPSYANYPVVGVSWVQANDFSKWRTDRVNELNLEKAGYLKKNAKTQKAYGEQSFSTDAYLNAPSRAYGGNDTIVFKGVKNKAKPGQKNVYAKQEFGLFTAEYRLPTEAEWEYAAGTRKADREYNNIKGRKKYPWGSDDTRTSSRSKKGDHLANYKQNRGDYGGVAGWATDPGGLTTAVKSFPPNDWGLYDMSGNVAEWVADVYRPAIASEESDMNYFRGNVYNKNVINPDGSVQIVDSTIQYDTLPNGKLHPKALPGQVAKTTVSEEDTFLRRNFNSNNSITYKDGDYNLNRDMYNAPENKGRYNENGEFVGQYDTASGKTTLINNNSRVIKGGSWKDRAYWLDPATRRYADQYTGSDFIGFRNAMTKIGSAPNPKKKPRG
ncbi:gliding motility lipoprotein GldJ [Myroides ceti]|uniref:Gliding motility lipoprotein GldJ n=1 Tax=Paenimyroides ceti TaxID=395087 RepID=A0ABT8CUC3_9FLAO|nr:gliding motility lipoprotein GldJ [Paenimyroides ceti]MDN3707789.1 gliding motility lipoprotein GldJ [Paenimyroides ceti]